ncbi:MBL fold metallo-hydrolase [Puia sp.]|jgi:L-ascorbate metabolism protein UlaG (beta-lactamase superfamily)|uniref:MBL fold metallo-hydrolase n=1 Tax=Puia sp. TaxID=2045100 RepID=UPI002F3E54F7
MSSSSTIIYIGGPTVILEIGGLRLMTDPTLDPAGVVFPINGKPGYSKLMGPAAADTGEIDIVLLSHDQHGDNLDNAGRALLPAVGQVLTTPAGAQRLGGNARGLAPWESVDVTAPDGKVITITGTPARHGPAGSEKITGDVTGFIVRVKSDPGLELYFTGDTVFYEGVEEVARRFQPQNVFVFAGAAKPRGPFNVTMGANDVLDTAGAFPKATITPLHFEGWSHFTENAETLKVSFAALGIADRLKVIPPGEAVSLPLA